LTAESDAGEKLVCMDIKAHKATEVTELGDLNLAAQEDGNDPVFPDAKLFRKGKVELPRSDTRMSLVPGKIDLNP